MEEESLPQKVNCDKCGAILYEGEELKSPEEIIQMHDGKCPKCGRRLSLTPVKIEVKPALKDSCDIREE
ncbi:hypothetical protein DRO35_01160 [Candidatus Bathyarchaeota archaeon]|nr:MAG: hypothetical protein DRO35_01160 [Candidatus Bathyarchaeota archaeon]